MSETENLSIAELLKKYRKECDMTQEELCSISGLSISTLKKYETGLRNPKPDQLRKIADALGVSDKVFMPIQVKDKSDVLMTLMQLDSETEMEWDYKCNAQGFIIPETITISFPDHELNKYLAQYILSQKNAKDNTEKASARRKTLYNAKVKEKGTK